MYPYNEQDPYYPPYYPPIYQRPSLLQQVRYSLNQMNLQSSIHTAQKTIYTINQIIPIVYQLRPVLHNAKAAFKVAQVVKNIDLDDIDQSVDPHIQTQK